MLRSVEVFMKCALNVANIIQPPSVSAKDINVWVVKENILPGIQVALIKSKQFKTSSFVNAKQQSISMKNNNRNITIQSQHKSSRDV
jgi:hypothetical protein